MEKKIKERIQKEKMFARLFCGINQLKYQPWKSIFLLVLMALFGVGWKWKDELSEYLSVPDVMSPIFDYSIAFFLIIFLFLSVVGFLILLGYIQGALDEVNIRSAFSENDCRNGSPVLISKKKIKREHVMVTVREFSTRIPMQRWIAMKESIQDELEITLVPPFVEYGGRNNDKGKRIKIYSIPGRKQKDWGTMYEERI